MKKKILVVTDQLPWGHRSIARAIRSYLEDGLDNSKYEIFYSEVRAEIGVSEELYLLAYRFLPSSNIIMHKLGERKIFRDLMRQLSVVNLKRLKKEVERIKPDLVISTYFFHSHTLSEWRRKENINFKLWTVVADPWTINLGSYVPGADLNLVYDQKGVDQAKKVGIEKDKIFKTGWWVRKEMYDVESLKENKEKRIQSTKKRLGFIDDRPIVFISGGSLGSSAITKILPSLMMVKSKVGIVFNTGTDKLLNNTINEFAKLLKRIRKDNNVQIVNLGWIENMREVLECCDLVMGKAGPNFLFDVVACEKPLVAITHISGQEDGNLSLIKEKKLGWIREKNGSAGKLLINFLENPEKYSINKKTIIEEAVNNKKTASIIIERIKKDII